MTSLLLAAALMTTNVFYETSLAWTELHAVVSYNIDKQFGTQVGGKKETQIYFNGFVKSTYDSPTEYMVHTSWTNLLIQTKLRPSITESNGYYWIQLKEKK